MPTFTLFTSIPPNSNYGPIVENWRASGFTVISINGTEESAQLTGVQTITIDSSDRKLPFTVILNAIRETGEPFAGFINADCKFIAPLAPTLIDESDNSVILAERIDIDPSGAPAMYRAFGFDALFFDTSAIANLKMNDAFRVGMPWWDYWLPYALELAGLNIKRFSCPILTHEVHSSTWSKKTWTELGQQFSSENKHLSLSRLDCEPMARAAYDRLRSSPVVAGSEISEPTAKLLCAIPILTTRIMTSEWRQHPAFISGKMSQKSDNADDVGRGPAV